MKKVCVYRHGKNLEICCYLKKKKKKQDLPGGPVVKRIYLSMQGTWV